MVFEARELLEEGFCGTPHRGKDCTYCLFSELVSRPVSGYEKEAVPSIYIAVCRSPTILTCFWGECVKKSGRTDKRQQNYRFNQYTLIMLYFDFISRQALLCQRCERTRWTWRRRCAFDLQVVQSVGGSDGVCQPDGSGQPWHHLLHVDTPTIGVNGPRVRLWLRPHRPRRSQGRGWQLHRRRIKRPRRLQDNLYHQSWRPIPAKVGRNFVPFFFISLILILTDWCSCLNIETVWRRGNKDTIIHVSHSYYIPRW